ncbi:hypothetical protein [Sinomonas gamaensis]|uniref:hypothetical protein n=1 Tax=Sinomonas gamaensis TaxID=2565624 RepID=UPI0011080217|nr:hypothetical protein [Sinomonas gamaensis]
MSSPDKVIADVHELIDATSLTAITFFKLYAERWLDPDVDPEQDFEIEPEYALNVHTREDDAGFRVLLETTIKTPIGEIACGVRAEYEHPGHVLQASSSDALTEFINGVALMHVLPFTRQGIADLTQRTFDAPLLMPIIQRGELEFHAGISATADRSAAG